MTKTADNKRPKPTQTPEQIEYVAEKLRTLVNDFEASLDLVKQLDLAEIQIKNWRNGKNGLEKVSDLAAELTRELGRIKDERILSSEAKPSRKKSS
jgi:transposase